MKLKLFEAFRYLLIALIVATLAFIFTRSTKPPEKSMEESNEFAEFVEEIIPPDTDAGEYVQKNIRKLAHFTEFMILGFLVSLYACIYTRHIISKILSLGFGLIFAACDETIQIFSGRGPSVTDVFIDFAGFATSTVIICTVWYLILFFKKKVNKS